MYLRNIHNIPTSTLHSTDIAAEVKIMLSVNYWQLMKKLVKTGGLIVEIMALDV